jgi:hypothetical protein
VRGTRGSGSSGPYQLDAPRGGGAGPLLPSQVCSRALSRPPRPWVTPSYFLEVVSDVAAVSPNRWRTPATQAARPSSACRRSSS